MLKTSDAETEIYLDKCVNIMPADAQIDPAHKSHIAPVDISQCTTL